MEMVGVPDRSGAASRIRETPGTPPAVLDAALGQQVEVDGRSGHAIRLQRVCADERDRHPSASRKSATRPTTRARSIRPEATISPRRPAPGGRTARDRMRRHAAHRVRAQAQAACTSAVGGFAFLLRDLTWPQAALMAAGRPRLQLAFVLPRLGGRRLWREAEHGARLPARHPALSARGAGAWCSSSDDRLEMAAALWGVLAFGDGMASLVGQALGGPRLPWNPRKSWAGFVAFVLFGALGAAVLMAWTLRLPARAAGPRRGSSPSPCRSAAVLRARGVAADDARRQPHRAAGRRLRPAAAGPGRRRGAPRPIPDLVRARSRSASAVNARHRGARLDARARSTSPGACPPIVDRHR